MITSYATLKDEVAGTAGQSWSHKNNVQGKFDTILDLAQRKIFSMLRVREMESYGTDTASTSSRFLALPTGYLSFRKLTLVSGSTQYPLVFKSPESIQINSSSTRPKSFTVTSQIEFDRIPDQAYTVEEQYYASPTFISSSNTTNTILTNYPNIYLSAVLYYVFLWGRDRENAVFWRQIMEDEIKSENAVDRKGRYGPAAAAVREGSTP